MREFRITAPLRQLYGTLVWPDEEFARLNAHPTWFWSYFYLCAGQVAVEYLHSRIELRILASDVFNNLDPGRLESTRAFFRVMSYITVGLAPVAIAIVSLVTAGMLYWLIRLSVDGLKFNRLFSIAVHCWAIVLIGRYCNLLILYLKGPKKLLYLDDLRVNLGLDVFLKGNENAVTKAILENITVFSLWYVVVLALGVSIVSGISKKKAAVAVAFVWALGVAWKVGQSMLVTTFQAPAP
jgi:hypothetical protein